MEAADYILFRFCNQSLFGPADRVLEITDFSTYVANAPGAEWIDSEPPNSLGFSGFQNSSRAGFMLEGLEYFSWCYEHHDGVVVHTGGHEIVFRFCKNLGIEIGCDTFVVHGDDD